MRVQTKVFQAKSSSLCGMFKELRIVHYHIIIKYILASYIYRLQGKVAKEEARGFRGPGVFAY